jgi:hypothetical protein
MATKRKHDASASTDSGRRNPEGADTSTSPQAASGETAENYPRKRIAIAVRRHHCVGMEDYVGSGANMSIPSVTSAGIERLDPLADSARILELNAHIESPHLGTGLYLPLYSLYTLLKGVANTTLERSQPATPQMLLLVWKDAFLN